MCDYGGARMLASMLVRVCWCEYVGAGILVRGYGNVMDEES